MIRSLALALTVWLSIIAAALLTWLAVALWRWFVDLATTPKSDSLVWHFVGLDEHGRELDRTFSLSTAGTTERQAVDAAEELRAKWNCAKVRVELRSNPIRPKEIR